MEQTLSQIIISTNLEAFDDADADDDEWLVESPAEPPPPPTMKLLLRRGACPIFSLRAIQANGESHPSDLSTLRYPRYPFAAAGDFPKSGRFGPNFFSDFS